MENDIHSRGTFQRYYFTTKAEISSEPVRCLEVMTEDSKSYLQSSRIYRQAIYNIFFTSRAHELITKQETSGNRRAREWKTRFVA